MKYYVKFNNKLKIEINSNNNIVSLFDFLSDIEIYYKNEIFNKKTNIYDNFHIINYEIDDLYVYKIYSYFKKKISENEDFTVIGKIRNISITDFAKRHFDKKFKGTYIPDYSKEDFEDFINNENNTPIKILDGYADFCKILIYENFTETKTGTMKITLDNYQYLISSYQKRREGELPVLTRYLKFPDKRFILKAKYLAVVIYDREQLKKEFYKTAHMNNKDSAIFIFNNDWGVVSIMAQNVDYEEPMTPATMLRNNLDLKFGGSGVELNKEKYLKSVKFWNENAIVTT